MARTNMDGKSIKLVLRWLLNREDLQDADIAAAVGYTASSYSRHKDDEDFPSFEELDKIGKHFNLSPTVLQIAFGLRDPDEVILLSDEEVRQYFEQGGANHHHPTLLESRKEERHRRRSRAMTISTPAMVQGVRKISKFGTTTAPPTTVEPWTDKPSA